jgi:hypothetical protein
VRTVVVDADPDDLGLPADADDDLVRLGLPDVGQDVAERDLPRANTSKLSPTSTSRSP